MVIGQWSGKDASDIQKRKKKKLFWHVIWPQKCCCEPLCSQQQQQRQRALLSTHIHGRQWRCRCVLGSSRSRLKERQLTSCGLNKHWRKKKKEGLRRSLVRLQKSTRVKFLRLVLNDCFYLLRHVWCFFLFQLIIARHGHCTPLCIKVRTHTRTW